MEINIVDHEENIDEEVIDLVRELINIGNEPPWVALDNAKKYIKRRREISNKKG